ncbi:AbrB/MazE/SpoVT family DNA-binding domain-containing protein [Bauldia sp.]|uniref:AbrB/MazE/SpoVT family DNA-binding domain-containing protein n=1 Tax=Bauldia sp. TaxID=2575872 RepID=UPI003BAD7936
MRVTSKGQVTIPKAIRDKAGIRPGSEVAFGIKGEVVTLKRAPASKTGRTRGQEIAESLRDTATRNRHLTTDEIMALLRGDD